jgi:type I restriction enzyme M protein
MNGYKKYLNDADKWSQEAVDQIWDRLWSSALSNPMDSIEQFSYLLFLKRLDDAENQREKQAKRRNKPFEPQIKPELRWSHWINFKAEQALKHVREEVFPWLRTAGTQGSSFERYMQNAEFKISKPGTLIEVCNLIDALKISEQNQDVQGDLYEYLLSKLNTAGRNGQFRTPRHIIRMFA